MRIVRNIDYCSKCGSIIGQNDDLLGISGEHRITKDLHEIITYCGQLVPGFKNAEKMLIKLRNINISATQIEALSEEVGHKLFESQMQKAIEAYNSPEKSLPTTLEKNKKESILYILMDGSAVNTRIEDENGSTWKEMKLGLTFLDKDVIRRKDNACIITKKEYVTYLGSVDEFKKLLFASAIHAGYGQVKKVVIIGDGAHWIWNMCKELFPDAECILDYYHMAENVYNYAKKLFPNNEKKYKKWAKTVIYYIETQQIKKALIKIENSPIKGEESTPVQNLSGYIQNNIDKINYLDYKNKNYYIGSGMIESGNKLVIQKRMKQAGMRWSISGAQYIAALRAKYESDMWRDVEEIIFEDQVA